MKTCILAVAILASGPAFAGGWNDYSGNGWGYSSNNNYDGSQRRWGQTENGFGGGESHRCVYTRSYNGGYVERCY